MRTTVGYSGGAKENPTYRSLGDHTESLLIEYDPAVVTYEALLRVFWESHEPTERAWSRQYMTAVFVASDEERRLAEESLKAEAARHRRPVATGVLAATRFYPAEDYHQKYSLRGDPYLFREFQAMYPDPTGFRASTAAARVNGVLGGCGASAEAVRAVLPRLGLTPEGERRLLKAVRAA